METKRRPYLTGSPTLCGILRFWDPHLGVRQRRLQLRDVLAVHPQLGLHRLDVRLAAVHLLPAGRRRVALRRRLRVRLPQPVLQGLGSEICKSLQPGTCCQHTA